MKPWLVSDALDAEECRQVVARAEARGFEPMGVRYPGLYRDNDRLVVDDPAMAATLFQRLRAHVPERWEEAGEVWELQGFNSRFRYCRYRGGQAFTQHRDGAWSPRAGERSWLTVMLYLNGAETFVGGETRFYEGEAVHAFPPRAGQAILFDHRLWHDGAPVTQGTKYVMRTDVMYRRVHRAGTGPVQVRPAARGLLTHETRFEGHEGYVWVVRPGAHETLLSGSRDGTARRWPSGETVRRSEGSISALCEHQGRLWTAGRNGAIDNGQRSWDGHTGAVLALEGLPDGSIVSCGADGAIRRWSPTGEPLEVLGQHQAWVWAMAVQGMSVEPAVEPITAIAVGGLGTRDGRVTLRDGQSWKAHDGAVTALIRVGDAWVSGGEDGKVRAWSWNGTWQGEGEHGDFVRSLTSLGGNRLASGSYDRTVSLWRLQP